MRRRHRSRLMTALLVVSLFVIPQAAGAAAPSRHATATLHDGTGAMIGWALFSDSGSRGVRVVVVAWGLSEGLHGLHIHGTGSCVAPFASAGSHFNPLNTPHGSHAGDLPNLPVGPGGVGYLRASSTGFTLLPGQLSIFDGDGAALVVHAGPDDYRTDPTGNSGSRVACGVITPIGHMGGAGR